jgi:hypothetical protein
MRLYFDMEEETRGFPLHILNTARDIRNLDIIDINNVEEYFKQDNKDEYFHIFQVSLCLMIFYAFIAKLYINFLGNS